MLRSPERWAKIVALAESLGETLPPEPSNAALEEFLLQRREAEPSRFAGSLPLGREAPRSRRVRPRAARADRSRATSGSRSSDYTHSTAPNRRFPDLITQRLLKAAMAGSPPPYATRELAALAAHCTEQEDHATKVERRVRKSAAALLLVAIASASTSTPS